MSTKFVLSVICLVFASVVAAAEETPRRVTVDGKGVVTAQPDMAHITMAIQARNIEVKEAREHAVDITRKFLALCDQLDIAEEKIHTSGLNIHPEYRWNDKTRQQELQAYLVRRQFNVELDELDNLGDLMEGAVDAGVNEVSPPRLASSRERDLRREALAAAARDAEANARTLAETLGVSLGGVVEISSSHNVVPLPMQRAEMFGVSMNAPASGADTYAIGEIRVEANVTASFALESN